MKSTSVKPAEVALTLQAIARALEAAVILIDDTTNRILAAETKQRRPKR